MRALRSIHQFDVKTFHWFLKRKHRGQMAKASRYVSRTGDGPLYVTSAIWIAYAIDSSFLTLFLAAFTLERGLYLILKHYFKRNRPPNAIPGFNSVIVPSDQFSFPSGHTSAAFTMAILVASLYPPALWILVPWAGAIGLARVMLGVHFPTDIFAGAILGSATAILAISQLACTRTF